MTPETGPCLATIDGQPEIAAIALALHEALADSRTSKDLAHALAVFLSRRGFQNVVVGTLAFGKQIIAKISTRLNGIPEGYLLFDPSGRRHPRILDNPEPCHYRSPPPDDSLAACMSLPDAMNMPDREWLELPILSGQQLWGVVYADRGGAPISNDKFAEACNISAIASQYVELVNARETRVNIARAQHELRKIDLSLAQVIYRIYHPDEASSLFHTIASAVVAATGCVCCDITMADKGKYEAVAQDGALSPIGLSLSDSEALCAHSLTIRAITSGEFQYILGPRTDPMYQAMMEKAAPGQRPLLRNIALWAAFPIRIGATVVGAISVCSPSREFLLTMAPRSNQGVCRKNRTCLITRRAC